MHDTPFLFPESRDDIAGLFLPENQRLLDRIPDETMDEVRRVLLGCDSPEFTELPDMISDTAFYVRAKEYRLRCVNLLYGRIFDFCRVLGVNHICDLGCRTLNQAFLLAEHEDMTYTGMDSTHFVLNDWREKDRETGNYREPFTTDAPPPFFDGRIRFVKGHYPDTPFETRENSIMAGCYSLTMTREHEIFETVFCLTQNFERMLFNVGYDAPEAVLWKSADWAGYAIHPIGPEGFVFATRHPEDIERLKQAYPCDDRGWFDTGIDSAAMPDASPQELAKTYIDWRRDMEE